MSEQDIRWLQRLSNYRRALAQLKKFIDKGELNELEQQGLIPWMGMIKSRNQSSHTYIKETADEIGGLIVSRYFDLFVILETKMSELSDGLSTFTHPAGWNQLLPPQQGII